MWQEIKHRIFNILLSLDQAGFCLITLGASYPDEAPSAAAWRLEQEGRLSGKIFRPLIDLIFRNLPFGLAETDHCRKAFNSEKEHRQNHPVYRHAKF